jgi:16S rRNA (guanine527-N7)-methyltransferase
VFHVKPDRDGDRSTALSITPVSRETAERLDVLVAELRRWQQIKNLVGPDTLNSTWTRHVADSLQLLELAPEARRWLDLGSGAGFPGLVLAVAARERGDMHVDLLESNGRKCAFLRHVARLTGAAATIHQARLETRIADFVDVDVVTARALAPLHQLVDWVRPLLTTGSVGLFPKGRDAEAELTEASKSMRFSAELFPSRTDSEARIIRIRSLHEK